MQVQRGMARGVKRKIGVKDDFLAFTIQLSRLWSFFMYDCAWSLRLPWLRKKCPISGRKLISTQRFLFWERKSTETLKPICLTLVKTYCIVLSAFAGKTSVDWTERSEVLIRQLRVWFELREDIKNLKATAWNEPMSGFARAKASSTRLCDAPNQKKTRHGSRCRFLKSRLFSGFRSN
jgi:hypothetical protein